MPVQYPLLLAVPEAIGDNISSNDLDCDWFSLLENGKGADCKLVINAENEDGSSASKEAEDGSGIPKLEPGESFGLHRTVLALRIPTLYRMFEEKFLSDKEKFGVCLMPTVHIQGDSRIWELILAYVYAGTTYLANDTILPVMQLAKEYHLDALYDDSLSRLDKFVTISNLNALKRYAVEVGDERLVARCDVLSLRPKEDPEGIDFFKISFGEKRKMLSKHFRSRS